MTSESLAVGPTSRTRRTTSSSKRDEATATPGQEERLSAVAAVREVGKNGEHAPAVVRRVDDPELAEDRPDVALDRAAGSPRVHARSQRCSSPAPASRACLRRSGHRPLRRVREPGAGRLHGYLVVLSDWCKPNVRRGAHTDRKIRRRADVCPPPERRIGGPRNRPGRRVDVFARDRGTLSRRSASRNAIGRASNRARQPPPGGAGMRPRHARCPAGVREDDAALPVGGARPAAVRVDRGRPGIPQRERRARESCSRPA